MNQVKPCVKRDARSFFSNSAKVDSHYGYLMWIVFHSQLFVCSEGRGERKMVWGREESRDAGTLDYLQQSDCLNIGVCVCVLTSRQSKHRMRPRVRASTIEPNNEIEKEYTHTYMN